MLWVHTVAVLCASLLALTHSTSVVDCQWRWGDVSANTRIKGYDAKRTTAGTRQRCMDKCDDEAGFTCRSIEYKKSDRICALQKIVKKDVPEESVLTRIGYIYRDRTLNCAVCELSWDRTVPGKRLAGFDMKRPMATTEQRCVRYCEEETDFTCMSIEYNPTNYVCSLQAVIMVDNMAAVVDNPDFVYRDRVLICPDMDVDGDQWFEAGTVTIGGGTVSKRSLRSLAENDPVVAAYNKAIRK